MNYKKNGLSLEQQAVVEALLETTAGGEPVNKLIKIDSIAGS